MSITDRHSDTGDIPALWKSEDPLVIAYAKATVTKNIVGPAQVKLQELQYKPLAIAVRKTSEWHTTNVVRNADPARGDPASVSVKCKKCGTLREDNALVFVKRLRSIGTASPVSHMRAY